MLLMHIRTRITHTPTVLHTSVIAQRRRPRVCGVERRLCGAVAGLQAAAQRGGGGKWPESAAAALATTIALAVTHPPTPRTQ